MGKRSGGQIKDWPQGKNFFTRRPFNKFQMSFNRKKKERKGRAQAIMVLPRTWDDVIYLEPEQVRTLGWSRKRLLAIKGLMSSSLFNTDRVGSRKENNKKERAANGPGPRIRVGKKYPTLLKVRGGGLAGSDAVLNFQDSKATDRSGEHKQGERVIPPPIPPVGESIGFANRTEQYVIRSPIVAGYGGTKERKAPRGVRSTDSRHKGHVGCRIFFVNNKNRNKGWVLTKSGPGKGADTSDTDQLRAHAGQSSTTRKNSFRVLKGARYGCRGIHGTGSHRPWRPQGLKCPRGFEKKGLATKGFVIGDSPSQGIKSSTYPRGGNKTTHSNQGGSNFAQAKELVLVYKSSGGKKGPGLDRNGQYSKRPRKPLGSKLRGSTGPVLCPWETPSNMARGMSNKNGRRKGSSNKCCYTKKLAPSIIRDKEAMAGELKFRGFLETKSGHLERRRSRARSRSFWFRGKTGGLHRGKLIFNGGRILEVSHMAAGMEVARWKPASVGSDCWHSYDFNRKQAFLMKRGVAVISLQGNKARLKFKGGGHFKNLIACSLRRMRTKVIYLEVIPRRGKGGGNMIHIFRKIAKNWKGIKGGRALSKLHSENKGFQGIRGMMLTIFQKKMVKNKDKAKRLIDSPCNAKGTLAKIARTSEQEASQE